MPSELPRITWPQAFLLAPYFSPRPWGGDRLRTLLKKPVPNDKGTIGEAWELADHPHGHSRIALGPYAGIEFAEVVRRFPRQMCGVEIAPPRFPLMVKYIDAAEDLSIQVHPDDPQAAEEGDRGKSECWLVMDCPPGAEIIHGITPGVTRETLQRAAETGDFSHFVRRRAIQPGDFLSVPCGTVHAILGGTLVCEIQRTSDVTYRLSDYNREPKRELHIPQALRATCYDPEARAGQNAADSDHFNTNDLAPGQWHELLRNVYFEVYLARWLPHATARTGRVNTSGLVMCIVSGSGKISWHGGESEVALGQTWYLTPGFEEWNVAAGPAGLRVLIGETLEL